MDIVLSTERNPWAVDAGGGQVIVHNQAVELCRMGHRTRVVYTFRAGESPPSGVDVPYEIVRADWSERYVTRALAMRRALARSLASRPADLLHVHCECSVGAYLAARSQGVPMVMSCHHPEPLDMATLPRLHPRGVYSTLRFRAMRFLVRRARALVFTSRWAVEAFAERGYLRRGEGTDSDRIHIVPNGVDGHFFSERGREASPGRRLISVGRLASQKRFDRLVAACRLLKDAGVVFGLKIIGEGPLRPDLERQIDALGLSDVVELAGYRDQAEVARELAASDVFVFSSASETFGLVVFEAMAAGLPVVVPDIPGLGEFVHAGENAVVYPSDDVEALANSIDEVLGDGEEGDRLGRNGRDYVRQELTWKASVDRLHPIYEPLLAGAAATKG